MVDIVRRNLLPDFVKALALHEVSTFSQLSSLCRKLEDSFFTCRASQIRPIKPITSINTSAISSEIICWNCNCKGHVYSSCRSHRTRFCYGCGKKNIIKSQCPTCTKNGERPESSSPTPGCSQGQRRVGSPKGKATKGIPIKSKT